MINRFALLLIRSYLHKTFILSLYSTAVVTFHFPKKTGQDCEFQKVKFLLLPEFDQYTAINAFSALKIYKTAVYTNG